MIRRRLAPGVDGCQSSRDHRVARAVLVLGVLDVVPQVVNIYVYTPVPVLRLPLSAATTSSTAPTSSARSSSIAAIRARYQCHGRRRGSRSYVRKISVSNQSRHQDITGGPPSNSGYGTTTPRSPRHRRTTGPTVLQLATGTGRGAAGRGCCSR